ncbi:MAG: hypothetical protein JRC99_12355 [Deltaproteobacteria bacterium]|nr:hypothetical protein [Deltaproteobacteria bacterium]
MKKSTAKKFFPQGMGLLSLLPLLLWGTIFTSTSFAEVPLPEWSGSIKSLNLYGEEAPADLFPEYLLSSNRARLNMDWKPVRGWDIETAFEYQYLWSDQLEDFTLPSRSYNRHLDLDKVWEHGDHAASRLVVDRLNLNRSAGAMDITVGRQAVGFGRILISSPLDVIAPFAPDAIDTDVRRGVDALHGIFNYGLDGQLGAIGVWGDKSRYNSFLATWSDNRAGLDMLMIGGRLRGRNMFGAGLAGSLGTLGLKGEFSIYNGRDTGEWGGDLHDSYALAAIETWYRFNNGISLITQYLYNGPGVDDPEDYPKALASAPMQEGLTYLLGKHYLIVAPAYDLHPLATAQGLIIYNIEDNSALIRPMLVLSLADNISLQIFWAWNQGQEPDVIAPVLPAEPQSEFGMSGDSGGFFLSWFF